MNYSNMHVIYPSTWIEPMHAQGEHANSTQKAGFQTRNPLCVRRHSEIIVTSNSEVVQPSSPTFSTREEGVREMTETDYHFLQYFIRGSFINERQ